MRMILEFWGLSSSLAIVGAVGQEAAAAAGIQGLSLRAPDIVCTQCCYASPTQNS